MSGLTTSDSLLEGLAYLTPPAPIPEVFRFLPVYLVGLKGESCRSDIEGG